MAKIGTGMGPETAGRNGAARLALAGFVLLALAGCAPREDIFKGGANATEEQKKTFPTFGVPAPAPGSRPVLDADGQKKMEADLQASGGAHVAKARQELEKDDTGEDDGAKTGQ